MSVKTYQLIIKHCNQAIADISRQLKVDDEDVAVAEALQAAVDAAQRRLTSKKLIVTTTPIDPVFNSLLKPSKLATVAATLRSETPDSIRKLEPREPKPPKPPKPILPPYGTYGEWDYPNKDWQREPTEDDISEIARQKLLRNPNSTLWQSEIEIAKWLKTRPNPQSPPAK